MKKRKSRKGNSGTKAKSAPKNFAEYLAAVPEPSRSALRKLRGVIRSALPRGATETISYRIPAFRSDKGMLVWFAAFSDHCSLFPTAAIIGAFKNELKDFSTSKGTIHFPLGKPLPVALIKELVRARVKQSQNRQH